MDSTDTNLTQKYSHQKSINYALISKSQQNNINHQNDHENLQITEKAIVMLIALVLIPLMLVSIGADKTIIIALCDHDFPRSEPKN